MVIAGVQAQAQLLILAPWEGQEPVAEVPGRAAAAAGPGWAPADGTCVFVSMSSAAVRRAPLPGAV